MSFDGWTAGAIRRYKQMELEYYMLGLSGREKEAKENWREAKTFYEFQNKVAKKRLDGG